MFYEIEVIVHLDENNFFIINLIVESGFEFFISATNLSLFSGREFDRNDFDQMKLFFSVSVCKILACRKHVSA